MTERARDMRPLEPCMHGSVMTNAPLHAAPASLTMPRDAYQRGKQIAGLY